VSAANKAPRPENVLYGKPGVPRSVIHRHFLSSKEVQSRTDEQLAKDIAGGTGQKKAIKPLSEKQMKDVIAFVRAMAKT
jgi:hypothetical protein